ncbi:glycoside hydrolase family 13 protein [Podospora didyma]|uniref:Alpha-amylase n=1 Tax=Podospora didyma TaxID=330526 RepID=A0AAE0P3T5_9PEZI|nr:glycoside hydrolase family 13 protein [Podospora didyma]
MAARGSAPHFNALGITAHVLLGLVAFASVCLGAGADEWQSRSIYQVMVDRFARTDLSTTASCTVWETCNGTWAGLISKLDYIQGMGFTAIQISPVVKNLEGSTAVGSAYHGYWSVDNYALNEHFGSSADLKLLSSEVHRRGMYLMIDVVVNNMAAAFNNTVPPPVDFSAFNPFNDAKYFHKYCNVTEWTNPVNYQDCWLYPYGVALADLNTDAPVVVDMMRTWIKGLVANYSIDGIRIDAAKHVNDAFLPAFIGASGVFAFGEVLTGETEDMCRYQTRGLLTGMPNYLEYFPLNAVFNGHSMEELFNERVNTEAGCNNTLVLGTFVENHDSPRFAASVSDMALAKNAMTYVLLNDGIPTVYQGQEQHFSGNSTPFNREPLWSSGYDTTATLYNLTATLNKLRNAAILLSPSYVNTTSETLFYDVNHLCLRKGPDGSQIVFCINNQSGGGPAYQLSIGGFGSGDTVVEVLSCTHTTADGIGNVTAYMDKGEPKVFFLASALNSSGLCPTTSPAAPASSAKNGGARETADIWTSTVLAGIVLGCSVWLFA